MGKGLDKWRASLFSAYPSFSSPYWRALPLRRMKKALMGVFFTADGVGFAVDLFQINHSPLAHGFFWPVLGGAMAASLFATRIKIPRLVSPLFLLLMVVVAGLAYAGASVSQVSLPDALRSRIVFDAVGIWLAVGVGFRLLLSFVTTEGLDNVRMQTELSLAHGIQATLVPTISFQNATFEVYVAGHGAIVRKPHQIEELETNNMSISSGGALGPGNDSYPGYLLDQVS